LNIVNGNMSGQLTVGQSEDLWVTVDLDSPTFMLTTLMTGNNLTSGVIGVNAVDSSTMTQLDVFRYRDGTGNQIGYYESDFGCFYLSVEQGSWNNQTAICQSNTSAPFNFFGAVY